ncbi:hypothetical protein GT354_18445 [Streptomyces sp. SID3343]|nr:hypothetical protein [Streptomyces sp. SID3343]
MRDLDLTQRELAERVNTEIQGFCGRRGSVSEGTVGRWVTGRQRWPQGRQRRGLEAVFGCSATSLGFVPRAGGSAREDADHVDRRMFVTTATGAAAASALGAPHRVGTSDVRRLADRLAELVDADDRRGGTLALERAALDLADQALDLQQRGTASQRVRGRLYGLAAAGTSSAMWAAADGQRPDVAMLHLDRAVSLAELSGDPTIKYRVWGHAGAMYRQFGRPSDALAAQDVARATSIARRDPLYASLAHARSAVGHGAFGDVAATRRSLGLAADAYARADPGAGRPPWMSFYDSAELEGLSMLACMRLRLYPQAEAHAHRSNALRRPGIVRNSALTIADLARAQLEQGAVEAAVASARTIAPEARHGRTAFLLHRFGTRLTQIAHGSPEARAWREHTHSIRRQEGTQ